MYVGVGMERVMLLFPPDLLRAVDAEAKRLGKKRSQVVRQVLNSWVEEQRRRQFEALLAEGYQEMAQHTTAAASEFLPLQVEAAEGIWRWDD